MAAGAIEVKVYPNGDYWQGKWYVDGCERKCSLGSRKTVSLRQARKLAANKAAEFAKKPGMASAGKAPRLAQYISAYLAGRTDLSKGSLYNYGLAGRYLRAHFGDDIRVSAISRSDAWAWRGTVAQGKLIVRVRQLEDPEFRPDPQVEYAKPTETTVCNITKYAKAMFAHAVVVHYLAENPFDKLKSAAPEPAKNWDYLSADTFRGLLAACESIHWRAILGLCRLGGLRRGEAVALPWSGVDLGAGRLTVYSSKTAGDSTGGKRVLPIVPELRAILAEARAVAGPGVVRVISTCCDNLLRDFDVIRVRAGLPEIPEPFQNMRRSRAQDWSKAVPLNTLAEWMGHSVEVASAYYLKTDEATFAQVSNTPMVPTSSLKKS